MVIRKRRSPAPAFRVPSPFNPMTGDHAPLGRNVYPTRVAMMQVVEEHDDYLTCRGYDPEAQLFLNEVSVAKPLVLQKTPWDGKTYEISSVDVTFTYKYSTTRMLVYDGGNTITQMFSYPYFVGDVLAVAKPMTKIGETPGTISESDCVLLDAEIQIMYDSQEKPIAWMDLNVAGRGWVQQTEYRGKLDELLSQGQAATVSIWQRTDGYGSDADSGENVEVTDWFLSSGEELATGTKVKITWFANDNRWYVTGAEC